MYSEDKRCLPLSSYSSLPSSHHHQSECLREGFYREEEKKLSGFPSFTKKWEIFRNFFGNSGKNVRQRSSLGKQASDMSIPSDIIIHLIVNGGGETKKIPSVWNLVGQLLTFLGSTLPLLQQFIEVALPTWI
jgi:hypothetical protein